MDEVKLHDVLQGLTMLAIEKSLLDFSPIVYDKVLEHLEENHNSYISDCYSNPQILREALTELYTRSYFDIVSRITEDLYEFRYQKSIERFLVTLNPKFVENAGLPHYD